MIPLNYHHLYYFYVIAKAQTIAKACEELYLAQSTLSAQLSQFEKSLGRNLFERRKQRLILTEDGRLVFDYAESIFEMGQEMQDVLRDHRLPERVAIQIGVLNGTPRAFCHSLTDCIYDFMPKAHISLQEENSASLLSKLREHHLDLVLTDLAMRGKGAEDITNHLVAKVPIVFAATKKIASKIRSLPKDFDRAPFVLPSQPSQVHRQVIDLFAQWKINPEIMAEVQDVEVARRMALSGRGIVPLNIHSLSASLPKGSLVPVTDVRFLGISEAVYLVTRNRKRLNPLAEHLLTNFKLAPKI